MVKSKSLMSKNPKRRRRRTIKRRRMDLTCRVISIKVSFWKMVFSRMLEMTLSRILIRPISTSMRGSRRKISIHSERFLGKVFTRMKTPVRTRECQTIRLEDTILFMSERFS